MVSGHVLVLGLARDWGLGFGEYFSVLWFLVICRGGDSSQAASLQGTIITSVSMLCSRWVSKVVTSRGTESVVVAEKRQTERAREGCMYVCMYVYIYIYMEMDITTDTANQRLSDRGGTQHHRRGRERKRHNE